MNQNFDIIIVGGGAAGFFTAINIVEKNPKLKVAILERGKEVLSKVMGCLDSLNTHRTLSIYLLL